jgi:hypothetical protein
MRNGDAEREERIRIRIEQAILHVQAGCATSYQASKAAARAVTTVYAPFLNALEECTGREARVHAEKEFGNG